MNGWTLFFVIVGIITATSWVFKIVDFIDSGISIKALFRYIKHCLSI